MLSFTVRLSNDSLKRIRFTQYSWGGGIFITSDKLIQEAIEHEPLFGRLFNLESVQETEDEKAAAAKKVAKKAEPEVKEEPKAEEQVAEAASENVVKVADFAEAKEYLIDNYGYKSAQLRSQKAITEAAEKNNITFEYA